MQTINSYLPLCKHYHKIKDLNIRDLFIAKKNRVEDFVIACDEITLDFSKNLISTQTISLFKEYAQKAGLTDLREQMFNGQKINFTEHRAVLHTALREKNPKSYNSEILNARAKIFDFATKFRTGEMTGISGKKFKYIVNIGIGGSYLGSMMAVHALLPFKAKELEIYFISNIDVANLFEVLSKVNLEETLFIVASKTFTTTETLTNANTVKTILIKKLGTKAIAWHFVALSTNQEAISNFGISLDKVFTFWDFVGGRYSIWSAIGLPLLLAIGVPAFMEFLAGAKAIDTHFKEVPFEKNLPFILGVIGIWYRNFFNYKAQAILPYNYYLRYFPMYLQQLDMESNGKGVDKLGNTLKIGTAPIVFGEVGTDNQHSFFQMLHQGSDIVPADFIACLTPQYTLEKHHDILMANMFAQTEALMLGKSKEEVIHELQNSGKTATEIATIVPHKVFLGNRPSNTILLEVLTPKTLGMLCAIYEHKVFVQGALWQINSFDQYGVELGKVLTNSILEDFAMKTSTIQHDSSTNYLVNLYKKAKRIL